MKTISHSVEAFNRFRVLLTSLLIATWFSNPVATNAQVVTPPQLFSGTLYLSTVSELNSVQVSILNAELERTNNAGSLIGVSSTEQAGQSPIWKLLSERSWMEAPMSVGSDRWSNESIERLGKLKRGSCVWIDQRALTATADGDKPSHAEVLRQCLARGVMVILEATHVDGKDKLAEGWDLLPDFEIVRFDEKPLSGEGGGLDRARLQIGSGCLLRIGRRDLANVSDNAAPECYCDLPPTPNYIQSQRDTIPSRSMIDLTATRRALVERQQAVFPADIAYRPKLASGSLVIVGGGAASPEIWDKFIELAGGKESRIVVLPTAVAEPEYEDDDEARVLKRRGAKEVRILPQHTREEVSSPEFLENLRQATGIWFGGGRQWRFVDAYWGTPAWDEIKQVLARGGVIGGSSAGATIQGDLLVRGSPLGNQIMVADGYRRGLGLMEGVAIDQHFKQRNRFDDLAGVVKRFPQIYGIGIDEGTALIVQSPNRCSVLGQGSVWLTLPGFQPRQFEEHPSGDEFLLESAKP